MYSDPLSVGGVGGAISDACTGCDTNVSVVLLGEGNSLGPRVELARESCFFFAIATLCFLTPLFSSLGYV